MALHGKSDLTADRFEALLLRLHSDRELAGERYEEIRWKLIKFFQWNSCFDAEDLVDETFNRIAEKLVGEEEIIDIAGYAWGIARKIRQEAMRVHSKTVYFSSLAVPNVGHDEDRAADIVQAEILTGESRLRCLRSCMKHLSPEDRKLLLAYHSPQRRRIEGRNRLAQQNGITALALRVRANRLRFKLEQCIASCLGVKGKAGDAGFQPK